MTAAAVAKLLKITPPAATRAYRGEAIAAADNLELVEKSNACKQRRPLIGPSKALPSVNFLTRRIC